MNNYSGHNHFSAGILKRFSSGGIFTSQKPIDNNVSYVLLHGIIFKPKRIVGKLTLSAFQRFFLLKNDLMEQKLWARLVDRFLGVKVVKCNQRDLPLLPGGVCA